MPDELADKLTAAVQRVLGAESLPELIAIHGDQAAMRQCLKELLPRDIWSIFRGNSTCIEFETPGELIIVDCGSGIRDVGYDLERRFSDPAYTGARQVHILLTHLHVDHICGIPFIESFYNPANDFTFWAPQGILDGLSTIFAEGGQLSRVFVPTAYREMVAIKAFRPIEIGQEFTIGQTRLQTYALNHPGGSVAYRLNRGGRTVVIATDHEHPEAPDRKLAEFVRGADLLYADAQYLPEEYDGRAGIGGARPISHRGWGHSTMDDVVATAAEAEVKRLHLGHHEPRRSDVDLIRLEERAQQCMARHLEAEGKPADACTVELAHEGLSIEI